MACMCMTQLLGMKSKISPVTTSPFRLNQTSIDVFSLISQSDVDYSIDKNAHVGSVWYSPHMTKHEAEDNLALEHDGTFVS